MEHQHYHNQQQQQQQYQQQQHEDNNGSSGGTGKSSFLCRQSSTRWIPTTDQIRILKDLYYNSGLRSPNAEQIQRISARLRQYGKIEGKNVFYWFQNHKARERQKKRLTVDIATNKFPNNMSSAGFSPTSPAMYGLGHMGSSGAGSLLMERTYRECSLPGGVTVEGGNMGWVGVETAAVPQFYYHQQRPAAATYYYEDSYYHNHLHQTQQQQEEEEEDAAGIETLALFPIHSQPGQQDQEGRNNSYVQPNYLGHQEENDLHHHNFHHHILRNNSNCSGMDTSLELSLNSNCAPHGST